MKGKKATTKTTSAPKIKVKDLVGANEKAQQLLALSQDETAMAAPLARDPMLEENIRLGIATSLFFGQYLAARTPTQKDDIIVARMMRVVNDPSRWKVIADFVWGEEEGFNTRPVHATEGVAAGATEQVDPEEGE